MDLSEAAREAGFKRLVDAGLFLGYQQRWAADNSPVKVIEKTRRCGLSWCEAGDTALLAARNNGMDSWYIGYNKEMAQEFIRDCAEWAKHYQLAAGEIEETLEIFTNGDEEKSIFCYVIRFASGHRITALSSRPSNLRGKQGRVIIDEAAFHDDLKELLKAALALLIWGGQVHVISTHNGEENYFNELIVQIRAGKLPYSLHRITLDEALDEGLYARICMMRAIEWTEVGQKQWRDDLVKSYGDGADEELFCVPARGGGAWLSRVLVEARMVPGTVVRWRGEAGMELWQDHIRAAHIRDLCERDLKPLLEQLDPKLRSVLGQDFARNSDLSVIAPCQIQLNLTRGFPFLLEMANMPFKAQEQILFYIGDRLPRFSAAKLDASGNGAYLAEVAKQKYGPARVEEVKFSEQWYRDNTAPLKAAFEDGTIQLPKDSLILDDLALFKLIRGVPRLPDQRVQDAHGQKRHGDSGIAILLAHAASRAEYSPIEFQTVGNPRVGYGLSDFLGGL